MKVYKYNSEKLVFESTDVLFKYKITISCLILLITFLSTKVIQKPLKEYVQTEIVIKEEDKQQKLFEQIDNLPFKYPDIIKAQMIIETSHFKSAVYKENNNAFGMRLAKQRLTLATGDNLKHATYRTVEESVIDRLIYESKYMSKLSREEYFSFLDRLYAEGEGYSTKLKQIIKNNKF